MKVHSLKYNIETHLLQSSLSTGPNKSRLTLAKWFALGIWHRTFGDFLYSSDINKGLSTLALIFLLFLFFYIFKYIIEIYVKFLKQKSQINEWRQWCVIVVVVCCHTYIFSIQFFVSKYFFVKYFSSWF